MKISFSHKLKKYTVKCNALRFGKHFIAIGRINNVQPIILEDKCEIHTPCKIYLTDIDKYVKEVKKMSKQNERKDDIYSTYFNAVDKCKKIMRDDDLLKRKAFDSCELRDVVIRCSIGNFLLISDYIVEYKKGSRMKFDFEKSYMLIVPYMRLAFPLSEILNYDDFDLVEYHGVYDELDDAMDGDALANLCKVSRNTSAKETEQ